MDFCRYPGITRALDPVQHDGESEEEEEEEEEIDEKVASSRASGATAAGAENLPHEVDGDVAPGQETVGIVFDDGDSSPEFPLLDVRLPDFVFTKQEVAALKAKSSEKLQRRNSSEGSHLASSKNKKKSSKPHRRSKNEWPFYVGTGWAVVVNTKRKRTREVERRIGVVVQQNDDDYSCVVRLCTEDQLLFRLGGLSLRRSPSTSSRRDSRGQKAGEVATAAVATRADEVVAPIWRLRRWRPSQLQGLCRRTAFSHCLQSEAVLKARFTRALGQLHRIGLVTSTSSGKLLLERGVPAKVKRTTFGTDSIGWQMAEGNTHRS